MRNAQFIRFHHCQIRFGRWLLLPFRAKLLKSNHQMVLVLVLGDLHIPQRALDLPTKFKKLLVPGKIAQILVTGNLSTQESYTYLKSICADIVAVRGEFDEYLPTLSSSQQALNVSGSSALKECQVVHHGSFTIGIIHGHQVIPWDDPLSLAIYARKMNVDILISGHTHQFHAFEHQGRLFVNPGSATGALSPVSHQDEHPSFVLMDIQSSLVNLYIYRHIDGNVQVEKVDYSKKVYE